MRFRRYRGLAYRTARALPLATKGRAENGTPPTLTRQGAWWAAARCATAAARGQLTAVAGQEGHRFRGNPAEKGQQGVPPEWVGNATLLPG